MSEPDENNNISIYNHAFSPVQEMNIYKYSDLYLIGDGLYIYNRDKLSLSKINYNGKVFNTYNLAFSDVTSLFPGVEVINMDAFTTYTIYVEKENQKANYILLSRYSQGWKDYQINSSSPNVKLMSLPGMFSINSNEDVNISFGVSNQEDTEGFSENAPMYNFTFHTIGFAKTEPEKNYAQYDEKTKEDEIEESDKNDYKPNMMPKIPDRQVEEKEENEDDLLSLPPQENLYLPAENE